MKRGFIYVWIYCSLYVIEALSPTTPDDDVIRSKHLGHQRLKNFFEEQTYFKLMATLLTNLLKNQPETYQKVVYDCLQTANSKQTYAQCVTPVILQHRAMIKSSGSDSSSSLVQGDLKKMKKRAVVRRWKKVLKPSKSSQNVTVEAQKGTGTARKVYKVKKRKMVAKANVPVASSIDDKRITVDKSYKETEDHPQPGNQAQKIKAVKKRKNIKTTITSQITTTAAPNEIRIQNMTGFTLVPALEYDNQVSTKSPVIQNVGEFLLSIVQNLKQEYGSWFKFPDIDYLLTTGNISYETNTFRHLNTSTKHMLNPIMNQVYGSIDHLMNSKLMQFKDNVDLSHEIGGLSSFNLDPSPDDTIHVLSPRFMPMAAKADGRPSVLSPDVLSLYEGGDNNVASLPDLMSGLTKQERKPWLDFFSEISGSADVIRGMQSVEFEKILARSNVDTGDGVSLSINSTFQFINRTIGSVYQMLNLDQVTKLNSKGYAFLDNTQLDAIYGREKKTLLQFDVDQFLSLNEDQKDAMIMDEILRLAYPSRWKRQNAPPCILAPYLGGTVDVTYLLAPQIVCPSVFSFIVNGPLVLSPYILSPYVFGPFILSPEVLNPFILSPYILSPTVLTPVVLTPSILNPIVLAPYILSPFVLSPSILSPTVLSPNILSPGVLGPSILSPVVLGPNILSPSALNPSVLSPSVLSPAILSPGVLNPSILSPGVLNHGVLSPAAKSPSIMSPCFLCKRRRKRDIFLQWLISLFKYEP